MNQVDNLLKTSFSSLKFAQQVEVKRAGAHQPADFNLEITYGGRSRLFCHSWFKKHAWVTVSIEKQSLFCFYCLLFNPNSDNVWTKTGCLDLKHMTEKIKKHEETPHHLNSVVKFKTFGLQITYFDMPNCKNELKVKAQTRNAKVSRNRHVFGKIIDCLLFCAAHEISLANPSRATRADVYGNQDGRGSFLDMLSMMSNTDSLLADHLSSRHASKYTTPGVQSEVLSCVHKVYLDELKKDVDEAKFVALQVDKISGNVGDKESFVVVLRFVKGTQPVDRFVSCVNVDQQSGQNLCEELKLCLEQFDLNNKLIAQSYRGSDIGSVAQDMMAVFPHARSVYSYDNQVESLIKDMCSSVTSVKLFFINISRFRNFFAGSPKRIELLRLVCREQQEIDPLADASNDKWNFESETVTSVYDFKKEILKCLENIIQSGWDDDTISEASALMMLLKQKEFLYFLHFFIEIFPLVSTFQKKFHSKTIQSQEDGAIKSFENGLFQLQKSGMMCNTLFDNAEGKCSPPQKRRKEEYQENLCSIARQVCDMILNNVPNYLKQTDTFSYMSFIHPKEFTHKKISTEGANKLCSRYSFLNVLKLGNEILAINGSQLKEVKNVSKLLDFFIDHDLMDSLSETYDVLRMALTIPAPVSPGYSKRFNTIDKIKAFCKTNWGNDGFNTLILCATHKDVISGISNLTNKVIDEFSNHKGLDTELKFI